MNERNAAVFFASPYYQVLLPVILQTASKILTHLFSHLFFVKNLPFRIHYCIISLDTFINYNYKNQSAIYSHTYKKLKIKVYGKFFSEILVECGKSRFSISFVNHLVALTGSAPFAYTSFSACTLKLLITFILPTLEMLISLSIIYISCVVEN